MEISKKRKLFLIFCAVFVVRLIQLFTVFSISGDGPVFIDAAKDFYQGDFNAGLAHINPPLYSLLLAAAYSVTHNWIVAGRFISFVFGLLTFFPVYFLAKDVFGEKVGSITAILFAFHPSLCKYPARVLTEATYIFFFACSVWLCWKAISKRKYSLYFLAGLTVGLNYLNRPEGIGVSIITVLFIVCRPPLIKRSSYKEKLLSFCALFAGVIMLAGPYIIYMKNHTGIWQLSRKKSFAVALMGNPAGSNSVQALELDAKNRIPAYSTLEGGYFKTLFDTSKLFVSVYYPSLFVLMLIGLVRRKVYHYDLRFELYIGVLCIFYILVFSLFYASARHLVPLVSACLFWAAIGFYELYHLVFMKVPSAKAPNLSTKTLVILLTAVILTLMPYVLRPQDRDKIGQKRVGKWMRENYKNSLLILTDLSRIAYYADSYFVSLQNRPGINNYDDLIRFAKDKHPTSYGYELGNSRSIDYIVIDKSRIARYCPNFLDSVNPLDLEVVHIQPKLNHSTYGELVVYKVK